MRPMLKVFMVLALSAGLAAEGVAQVPTALATKPKPATAASSAAPLAAAHPAPTPAKPKPAQPAPIAPPPAQASGARLAPGTPIPPAELEAFVDGVVRQAMTTSHICEVRWSS